MGTRNPVGKKRASHPPKMSRSHFFLVAYLQSLDGLSESGTTRRQNCKANFRVANDDLPIIDSSTFQVFARNSLHWNRRT